MLARCPVCRERTWPGDLWVDMPAPWSRPALSLKRTARSLIAAEERDSAAIFPSLSRCGTPVTTKMNSRAKFRGTEGGKAGNALLGCPALQEMPQLAGFAGRALARIATDLGLQLDDVDELVGLAAQLIGDHRRLCRGAGDHGDTHPAALHRLDQRAEIPVAGVDQWPNRGKFLILDDGGVIERP